MLTDTFLLSKYSELLTVLKRENCEKSFKKFVWTLTKHFLWGNQAL